MSNKSYTVEFTRFHVSLDTALLPRSVKNSPHHSKWVEGKFEAGSKGISKSQRALAVSNSVVSDMIQLPIATRDEEKSTHACFSDLLTLHNQT